MTVLFSQYFFLKKIRFLFLEEKFSYANDFHNILIIISYILCNNNLHKVKRIWHKHCFMFVTEEKIMIRGIYNNSSAMQYLQEKQDIISNNLANTDTNGFKRSGIAFNQLMAAEQAKQRNQINHPLPQGEIISYIENTQGPIKQTNNDLNFAIHGEGFFAIQTPEGKAWTRDGMFTLNSSGYLSTMDGNLLMGEYGPILVNGNKISLSDKGDVLVDNQIVNKLLIENFDIKDVVQSGDNLYRAKNGVEPDYIDTSALIMQGYLESSNVSIVKEMVEMIAINRQYQANDKAIKTNDEALNKAVNNIAR